MTVKVTLPFSDWGNRYAIPALCVYCGGTAVGSPYTMDVGNYKGKTMVTMKFPLCSECGDVRDQAAHTHLWSKQKLPEEAKKNVREIRRCVSIPKAKTGGFGKHTLTFEFKNDVYGSAFEIANGDLNIKKG